MFEVLYKKATGLDYNERLINDFEGTISRKDEIYEILVKKYFFRNKSLKNLMLLLESLKLSSATELAFLSYIYALNNRWEKAIINMEKVIELEGGQNIDSFIDYGHFLRKYEKYESHSNKLLLNLTFYRQKYIDGKNIKIIKLLDD